MKNTYISIIVVLFLTFSSQAIANDWGKTGHRVIGEVAQQHLTPKTTQQVNTILNGMSLAFASTYADEIRSDGRYNHLAPWHYVNMEKDICYNDAEKNPNGDIVTAMQYCIDVLKNAESSVDDKAFYLKLLVHFIGDIHQPLHAGRKSDKGGNDINVTWFGEPTNLHRLWDSDLIDHYQMSYTELTENLPKLSEQQKRSSMAASRLDWVHESQQLATRIYEKTPADAQLGYVYHYQNFDTVRDRLLHAGLRLAATLNAIFDPATS